VGKVESPLYLARTLHLEKGLEMGDRYRIQDLPPAERPRERLAACGAEALTSAELIGILLRTGVEGRSAVQLAQDLLLGVGGLTGLHRIPLEELCAWRGIGRSKAAQIKAAIELGRRLAVAKPEETPVIQSPGDAAALLLYEMGALEQEHLRVLLLDTRNRLLRMVEVYHGSLNSSLIRVGEVFRDAVRANAAAIVVVHNHPSGDPTPSADDVAVTRAIIEAGKLLDIEVLDHIVLGKGRYVSLKEKGLGFS
jgi:DNA repair protein RadC